MKIPFTKMHGIGNDYIYVNCMEHELPHPSQVAIDMSPRHFSVGADGLVLICPSKKADAKMRMFNADGSEGMMCGNAIRCVGKYLYDNDVIPKKQLTIETLSGIKTLQLTVKDGKVTLVTVDMGKAVFDAAKIPIDLPGEAIMTPITVQGKEYAFTGVSMGNPHAVIYGEDPALLNLEAIGPDFEHHPLFPQRVNTEFVQMLSPTHFKMRVWERGSGETWACGTGACAVVAAAVKNGLAPAGVPVTVSLVGGDLTICCTDDYQVTMTGPAEKSYDGVYEL